MRHLISGCAYVRTYMSVTLRNVNLRSRSRSGTLVSLMRVLHKDVEMMFLGDEGACVAVKCRNEY